MVVVFVSFLTFYGFISWNIFLLVLIYETDDSELSFSGAPKGCYT